MWLLDEPTTALDAKGQSWMMSLLEQHLSIGGIAVIATHHELPIKNIHSIFLDNT